MRSTLTVLLCSLSLGAPTVLDAQAVVGRMLQGPARTPVAGAFVLLTDTLGNEVARALTDGNGAFTLEAPRAGRFRLQSAMIGWHTTKSPTVTVATGERLRYDFAVIARPVRLVGIEVTGERRCTARNDASNDAVVTLWEEAVKALRSVVWTADAMPLQFRWVRYERTLDPRTLTVLDESAEEFAGTFRRGPFATPHPDTLHALGFVRALESGGWVFEGPDAEVLLSDQFAGFHCFGVSAHADDHRLVGLAFRPDAKRTVPEIAGTLWLDRNSAELRSLEFQFVQLPWDVDNDHLGGWVEFQRLPTGAWVVRRWWVRMPVLELHLPGRQGRWRTEQLARVRAIREEGALVTEVLDTEGRAVALDAPGTIAGIIYDSTTMQPVSEAAVRLLGTSYRGVTDASGSFAIGGVPPGTYLVDFAHPQVDRLPTVTLTREVTVLPAETAEVWMGLPTKESQWRQLCPNLSVSDPVGIVTGFVTYRREDEPAAEATVAAKWRSWTVGADLVASAEGTVVTAIARPDGAYVMCGVPAGAQLELTAALGNAESRTESLVVVQGEIARLDLPLRLRR